MYTGFTSKFRPKNAPLNERDVRGAMWGSPDDKFRADDRLSCIAFNSTYIEFVDRWYGIRGSATDPLSVVGACLFAAGLWVVIFFAVPDGAYVFSFFIGGLSLFMELFLLRFLFRREFFTYTHWPIRFNRKNRMVYVFRHNGRNGVLRVPFDEVYFHLGHAKWNNLYKDLRGEVLDGKIVTDTFAVGEMKGEKLPIAEMWEFILRYMECGPGSLDFQYINGSTNNSWRNAYVISGGRVGSVLTKLFFPFIMLTTLTRWLVMKSCKTPQWPEDVEAECAVAPNDPYDMPQPSYSGEFITDEDYQRNVERDRVRNKNQ